MTVTAVWIQKTHVTLKHLLGRLLRNESHRNTLFIIVEEVEIGSRRTLFVILSLENDRRHRLN